MDDGSSRRPVVFLMGPTAAGKTDLAVGLVERFPLDIISVDSAMVYRGMDIGTGKPSAEVLARAAHRLIDIRDPQTPYSAAEFRQDAGHEIEKILTMRRTPLLVGGTGLYFRALRRGLAPLPPANPEIRARLALEGDNEGWAALHARLTRVDPLSATRIHPNDPQRIQRALEVFEITGQPMTKWLERARVGGIDAAIIPLTVSPRERSELYRRISRRFDVMLETGLIGEVEELRSRAGVHRELASMRAVGYRQIWEYLETETDVDGMRAKAIAATRQLARRQLTWLRADAQMMWFDSSDPRTLDTLSRHLQTRLPDV